MEFLSELNPRQKEAAETIEGPVLIVAGAGSGKTRALTYRIAYLIANGAALPWQILAVTFTNKAAQEMKTRVEKLLQEKMGHFDEGNQPRIGTFHSICVGILRRHFDRFGREKTFVIYDTVDQKSLMTRILKEQKIDDDRIKPQTVLSIISNAKNQLQTADDFKGSATGFMQKTIAELYAIYEKQLEASNALDFDDLLCYTVKLFKEHADVLDYYQNRWKFISIDEYQDTNHAQYVLANLLAAKHHNLCVIGDSDQSIYGFRGADIHNILNFEKDYPEAKLIKLEQNYRSTQNILDVADAIIEKNTQRKSKKMWTEANSGELIDIWHLQNEREEAERVIQEIDRLRSQENISLKDIVILYRTNAQSRLLEEALLAYGMAYKVIGGIKFYSRKEIKDILAYLRVVLNPNDTDSLLRIINTPSRKIGLTTLNKLQAFAMERSINLAETLKHIEMVSSLNAATKTKLAQFWSMIQKWRQMSGEVTVSSLLKTILSDINYERYLRDGTEQGDMRYENTLELLSVTEKYNHLEPQHSLSYFLEEVALVADTDKINSGEDALTLMTLHSAKGLEYSHVFIVGCEDNIFPSKRCLFEADKIEEERRLMYVGVTRAMKKLYLVAAKRRQMFGDFQMNPLSRFIHDIPGHLTREMGVDRSRRPVEIRPIHTLEEESESEVPRRKFSDGEKVSHKTFGDGVVVEQRGRLITIAFRNPLYGIKKFVADVAPLKRV